MKIYKSRLDPNVPHSGIKLTLILALLLVSSGCNVLSPKGPGLDEIRENISLEEAQKLTPFSVCLPAYMPVGIDATPNVTYHADFRDPMESDVRLRYHSSNDQVLMIEIYQRHRPKAATPESIETRGFYLRELIGWQTKWEEGWSKVKELSEQVTINVTKYQDGEMKRWLFEIVEPTSLRANMIMWGNDPVHYQVYTYLPSEEAKSIVQSIPGEPDCDIERVNAP